MNVSLIMRSFASPTVARVFAAYPAKVRARLMELRELVFDVAARTPGVGPLEEALKWGQPGYLTVETGSGSTVRLDAVRNQPGTVAMYFHCQTTLVRSFRGRFGPKFRYEGIRALLFPVTGRIPERELRECIVAALTYHLEKGTRILIDRPG